MQAVASENLTVLGGKTGHRSPPDSADEQRSSESRCHTTAGRVTTSVGNQDGTQAHHVTPEAFPALLMFRTGLKTNFGEARGEEAGNTSSWRHPGVPATEHPEVTVIPVPGIPTALRGYRTASAGGTGARQRRGKRPPHRHWDWLVQAQNWIHSTTHTYLGLF
ncbi:uncharacterized protein LOC116550773 [Sapajus apella]|uniref:Uncharacterized protein LOC116550773 n=1 Tax=Sapajus apella TaxID=9515 RepID=A0A6J3HRJ0_SAPAP|nr:uncharacterized protein LOC116550773 [Sapajus apella]